MASTLKDRVNAELVDFIENGKEARAWAGVGKRTRSTGCDSPLSLRFLTGAAPLGAARVSKPPAGRKYRGKL